MSLWMVIVLLGLLKLPVAALMLWIPFREDQAMYARATGDAEESGAAEDDGGSIALAGSPLDPHPRSPRPRPRRRGPHGGDATTPPPSPPRVRRPAGRDGVRTAQRLRLR
jgi:hypothetical protein